MPRLLIFGNLLFLLLLLACSGKQSNREARGSNRSDARMVVGVSSDLDTFNPLYTRSALGQEITHLILLGLADLNEEGEFEPELAESWEHSEDFLSLTYHLRREARWSDGHPVTAYDVEFTYQMIMDPAAGSPRQGYTEYIQKVEAVDSFTVVFHFSEAYPYQIFDTAGEIIPRHLLENVKAAEMSTHPIGRQPLSNGPFLLKRWEPNQYIELVPNPHYFAQKPLLDNVVLKIVPDGTNLYTQLQTGEVDMLLDVPLEKVSKLQSSREIRLYNVQGRVYNFIGYNQRNALFTDFRVRRALTMAVDCDKIIEALLFGYGRRCVSPFPPALAWAYNKNIQSLPFDPEASRRLLAEAGWTDSDGDGWLDKQGRLFKFDFFTNADNQIRADMAVIIQQQWKKIGVKADIQLLEWTALMDRLQ
ncbi:MAG: ABC transporter substrate-binding protein, partial [Calditrichia bacterium]